MDNKNRPEWAPEDAGIEFASSVMHPAADTAKAKEINVFKRKELRPEEFAEGILSGDRGILSRAITIIESNAPKHFDIGQEIIRLVLPNTGNAVRVGITGVPGAGKSTFIEALGSFLCDSGRKIAVLAVDPSSSITKGSILGDKTRMESLSRRREAFIRPSPSGGTLGGVTRKSRETILLCEAAGFDTILVETVGVGQSETLVRSMVDFFLVLTITGAGDELQGIKKGIIETADAILVNKADGDNYNKAMASRAEYEQVLHYLRPPTPGWTTKAYVASALKGTGIKEIWDVILKFVKSMTETGYLMENRQRQMTSWVRQMVEEYVKNSILGNDNIKSLFAKTENELANGLISPSVAVARLINAVEEKMK